MFTTIKVQIFVALVAAQTSSMAANSYISGEKGSDSLLGKIQGQIARGLLGELAPPADASKQLKSKRRYKRPPPPHAALHHTDEFTASGVDDKQYGTKEYRDGSELHSLPSAYLNRPFNLAALVSLRTPNRCASVLWKFHAGDITNLAIARTGSESITKSLLESGQPAHHVHDCTLAALSNRGATRLLVTLRHPVARIISGYQRRMDPNVSTNKVQMANIIFAEVFSRGVDDFVSALRLPQHRYHREALECTYGPDRQSFMLPLVGWYFGDAVSELNHSEDSREVEIRFLCTNRLSADFRAAASAFGFALTPLHSSHQSNISSDAAAMALDVNSSLLNADVVPKKLQLSRPNVEWLEEVYKKDIEFVTKRCGEKIPMDPSPGAPASSSTAIFTCLRGDTPGTCIESTRD